MDFEQSSKPLSSGVRSFGMKQLLQVLLIFLGIKQILKAIHYIGLIPSHFYHRQAALESNVGFASNLNYINLTCNISLSLIIGLILVIYSSRISNYFSLKLNLQTEFPIEKSQIYEIGIFFILFSILVNHIPSILETIHRLIFSRDIKYYNVSLLITQILVVISIFLIFKYRFKIINFNNDKSI